MLPTYLTMDNDIMYNHNPGMDQPHPDIDNDSMVSVLQCHFVLNFLSHFDTNVDSDIHTVFIILLLLSSLV